jgi:uncharacterized membrane protein
VNVINGLPAHVLLVHAIVVLVPLTAALEILCGMFPPVRRCLVWLVLVLALITAALTPITANAGEWLIARQHDVSAILQTHADRGDKMLYFSIALAVVAIVLAILHVREGRAEKRRVGSNVAVAILALAVGVSSIIFTYMVGDAGAQSVWGHELSETQDNK